MKLKLERNNLRNIRDAAINHIKNISPDPRKDGEEFLTEAWIFAVISELNRLGLTDIEIDRDDRLIDIVGVDD